MLPAFWEAAFVDVYEKDSTFTERISSSDDAKTHKTRQCYGFVFGCNQTASHHHLVSLELEQLCGCTWHALALLTNFPEASGARGHGCKKHWAVETKV